MSTSPAGHGVPLLLTMLQARLAIAGVRQGDVEDCVAVERERGLATSTLTTKLMAARSLFGWLIETDQHPGPNPAAGVRPVCARRARRPGPVTPMSMASSMSSRVAN